MSTRAPRILGWWLPALVCAAGPGLLGQQAAGQAAPQLPPAAAEQGEPAATREPAFFEQELPEEELRRIDELLEDDASLLDTGFLYDSGGRRDPFRSLLAISDVPPVLSECGEGVAGLRVDQVTVTGIMVTGDGPVAQVQSSGSVKSFLLRPGDQLCDGDVVRIEYTRGSGGEVIFRQVESDPAAPKPFKEVIKRLQP
ncbi:MAG TPA: hypothetical protein VMV46_23135 [Thermoanaerobaculia bacterium]|nr:hypothetical protein [Thermoanaerobaculia bacterium]